MSRTRSECEDGMISKDQTELPLGEEGSFDGSTNGVVLKKGPWTSAEDAILIEYGSQQCLDINGVDSGNKGQHDILQTHNYGIPDVMFDNLKTNQSILPYVPELPAISASSLIKGLCSSQHGSFMSPTMHRHKRLREATLPSSFSGGMKNDFHVFEQFQDGDKAAQYFGSSFPFDPDSVSKNLEIFGENQGSHTLANGNFSASKPTSEAVKLELPSLQYAETDLGGWGASCSSSPLIESVDTFIQSPPTGIVESNFPSPRNSGLLDALLYEARTLSRAKNRSSDKSSNSSTITPGDDADCSVLNISETEWEEYGDPISPLGHPATSLFSECTPISASGSSLDESQPTETITGSEHKFAEYNMKSEPVDHAWTPDREKESYTHLNITRPDALLDSDWLEHDSGYGKDQVIMTEAIAALLGDDLSSEYKQMDAGASTGHGWGLGSCSWNNMPAVFQMSELP
ncbi:hypothetical protein SADUNF_Sadunf03G0146300 [Salix dunnii]|uniref:Uncharacterized protein n=1 Tax=Salix dunnii TaxID=1413687 RepID=A0A835N4W3_9ROSI|nr:hypothetical protein SADUNF_Sadunf03G0146300 [Salix dunnii]